jgi:hypothetical protein
MLIKPVVERLVAMLAKPAAELSAALLVSLANMDLASPV